MGLNTQRQDQRIHAVINQSLLFPLLLREVHCGTEVCTNHVAMLYGYLYTCINYAYIYRVAQKVSHYQMIKKSHQIVLKPVNKIRFIIKLKYESNTII